MEGDAIGVIGGLKASREADAPIVCSKGEGGIGDALETIEAWRCRRVRFVSSNCLPTAAATPSSIVGQNK